LRNRILIESRYGFAIERRRRDGLAGAVLHDSDFTGERSAVRTGSGAPALEDGPEFRAARRRAREHGQPPRRKFPECAGGGASGAVNDFADWLGLADSKFSAINERQSGIRSPECLDDAHKSA